MNEGPVNLTTRKFEYNGKHVVKNLSFMPEAVTAMKHRIDLVKALLESAEDMDILHTWRKHLESQGVPYAVLRDEPICLVLWKEDYTQGRV